MKAPCYVVCAHQKLGHELAACTLGRVDRRSRSRRRCCMPCHAMPCHAMPWMRVGTFQCRRRLMRKRMQAEPQAHTTVSDPEVPDESDRPGWCGGSEATQEAAMNDSLSLLRVRRYMGGTSHIPAVRKVGPWHSETNSNGISRDSWVHGWTSQHLLGPQASESNCAGKRSKCVRSLCAARVTRDGGMCSICTQKA